MPSGVCCATVQPCSMRVGATEQMKLIFASSPRTLGATGVK